MSRAGQETHFKIHPSPLIAPLHVQPTDQRLQRVIHMREMKLHSHFVPLPHLLLLRSYITPTPLVNALPLLII